MANFKYEKYHVIEVIKKIKSINFIGVHTTLSEHEQIKNAIAELLVRVSPNGCGSHGDIDRDELIKQSDHYYEPPDENKLENKVKVLKALLLNVLRGEHQIYGVIKTYWENQVRRELV